MLSGRVEAKGIVSFWYGDVMLIVEVASPWQRGVVGFGVGGVSRCRVLDVACSCNRGVREERHGRSVNILHLISSGLVASMENGEWSYRNHGCRQRRPASMCRRATVNNATSVEKCVGVEWPGGVGTINPQCSRRRGHSIHHFTHPFRVHPYQPASLQLPSIEADSRLHWPCDTQQQQGRHLIVVLLVCSA